MSKVVVIVDGCSTGVLLAQEFNRAGFRCVHVQSSVKPPLIMTGAGGFHAHEYIAAVVHTGDLEKTVAFMEPFDVAAVLAGAEPAVELADALAAAIGVPCNLPSLALARRDKHLMANAVIGAGLRGIPTHLSTSASDALAWIERHTKYPVVVKPPKSGGTDGVTLCEDPQQVAAAFAALMGEQNILAILNDALVVQPYMDGVEYIVDTASRDGVHMVTDIWRYGKRPSFNGASFVYDHAWLLPAVGAMQTLLANYSRRVLDSLGIRNGAAHCEVILNESEPVLIEVGSRICGGFVPVICKAAIGSSQVDAVVRSIQDPVGFKAEAAAHYQLRTQALRVLLISEHSGELTALPRLSEIHRLRSFHSVQLAVQPAGRISKTTNFYSHPGKVDLMHSDPEVLREDMARIRHLEADGFYQVKELNS